MDRTAHLIITILVCAFLFALGTVGYMLIEGWSMLESLYMTVITFSTVGFGGRTYQAHFGEAQIG